MKTCKKYKTVLENIVKQFLAGPCYFSKIEKNNMLEYLKKDYIKEHWI